MRRSAPAAPIINGGAAMRRAANANQSQRRWRHGEILRETLALLETEGFQATIEQTSKHFKVRFGKAATLIASATPSHHNAAGRNRALVRRLIRREQQRLT
jgi:hypothetical protein